MLITCWSVKGGVGTTVVATTIALRAAADGEALLVDPAGDVPAVLGLPDEGGPGVGDWLAAGPDVPLDALGRLEVEAGGRLRVLPRGTAPARVDPDRVEVLAALLGRGGRTVVVDAGVVDLDGPLAPLVRAADRSLLVLRPCYLALRRLGRAPGGTEVVLVEEPGRSLTAGDVAQAVGAPVVTRLGWDPAVARAVDAGLLATRLPRSLRSVAA